MASNALETSPRAVPFDVLAETYDRTFTNSFVGVAQRQAVWEELDRTFHAGQRVLELNCGTGVDAVHLAGRGVEVLACDVSARMIEVARRRASSANVWEKLQAPVEFRVLATEDISTLCDSNSPQHFDGAFSNFAGLNCVKDLAAVARELAKLLRPGGRAVLCLFGRFCAWELIWYLCRGYPHKAFRRLTSVDSTARLTESTTMHVRYRSVREMTRIFAPCFRLGHFKGIGVTVPPSYVEPLAAHFPGFVRLAAGADRWLGRCPAVRVMADHVLLTFERAVTASPSSAALGFET